MSTKRAPGTLALIGGGEWHPECRGFDAELIAASEAKEVVVLPTAAAFEQPEHAVERAEAYFAELDVPVAPLRVLHRSEAEDPDIAADLRKARLVYLADGSPLHLRSVLKDSLLFAALLDAYRHGATIAASRTGRNWLHLDLYTDDQAKEVERLLGLGATLHPREAEPDEDFVVLADPDGNLFCVVDTTHDGSSAPGVVEAPVSQPL